MDIEGREIVRWLLEAEGVAASLLVGVSFSDSNSEWEVVGHSSGALRIQPRGESSAVSRAYRWFGTGTFTVDESVLASTIRNACDRYANPDSARQGEWRRALHRRGISSSTLSEQLLSCLGDATLKLDNESHAPDNDTWNRIYQQIKESVGGVALTSMLPLLEMFLQEFERKSGKLDVYRRNCVATLYRKARQLDRALDLSEVVQKPREQLSGSTVSIALLCSLRAWLFVDKGKATLDPKVRERCRDEAQVLYRRPYGILQNADGYVGDADLLILKGAIDSLSI